jgi:PAS domain-containing protein
MVCLATDAATDARGQPTMSLPLATHFSPSASPAAASNPPPALNGGGSTSPLAVLLEADEELRRRAAMAQLAAAAQAVTAPQANAAPAAGMAVTVSQAPAVAPAPPLPKRPRELAPPSTKPPAFKLGSVVVAAPVPVVTPGGLPEGFLPGMMGGRVGLLSGVRPIDKLEYYGVRAVDGCSVDAAGMIDPTIWLPYTDVETHTLSFCTQLNVQELPKKKRASPTDLSGLTDEEKVERRKRQAREYSRQARVRNSEMKAQLLEEVDALYLMRTIFEDAPHVYMVLSGDVRRTTILYANQAAEDVLHHDVEALLGRCVKMDEGGGGGGWR